MLYGDYKSKHSPHNISTMIVRKIMADLLKYTKKIAQQIAYYEAIIDFTDDTHWFNPFYDKNEIVVVWTDLPSENENF